LCAAVVAGNDAPLIGERASAHGRIAMDSGDERVGVKRRYPFERQRDDRENTVYLSQSSIPPPSREIASLSWKRL